MSLPVTIENDAIRLEMYPHFGGKIASILDKADRFELLFDYAAELPTGPQYDRPYAESWHAGWDECFPAIAPGVYPSRPYAGIMVPDHGELWGLPANATPTKDGITVVWHGLRFGYILSRKISLEGPGIVSQYTLTNLAPFDLRFVWAQHGLLSIASEVEIDIGERPCRLSHNAAGDDLDESFTWPASRAGMDFSRPASLPGKGGWKIFTSEPIASAARISYASRGRRLTIDYSSADGLPAYWGIWISTGGWMGHRHIAIEPTTGRFDAIDQSVNDRTAGRVEPNGKREWTVRWTLG